MIKFKPVNKVDVKEKQFYLFFTFSDEEEVKKCFKEAGKLLNQEIHSTIQENFTKNSENQFIYYFGSGSSLLIQKVGKKEKLNPDTFRRASSSAIKKLNSLQIRNLNVIIPKLEHEQIKSNFRNDEYYIQSIIEGIELGSYKFDQYLSKKNNISLSVELFYPKLKSENINSVIRTSQIILKWVKQARDLQNIPGCDLYPEVLANKVKSLANQVKNVKVKVFNQNQIREMKMGGLNAVGKGSEHPPRFIVIEYLGKDKKSNPYVVVGKGITFDSGGISLKPSANMWEMKGDMSGAASTLSAIFASAELKLKINLVGLIPAAENMPSGKATKPGDIIRTASGKSIEIDNTDAEGRLILADALEYAVRYKPKYVIDLATLTGACVVGLGTFTAGLFSRDDELVEKISKAGFTTSERVWRLPLWDDYHEKIKSDFADVKNVGDRWGGAITAACFLEKFVDEKYKWAHIDIAGTSFAEDTIPYLSKTMTGFGVRLLLEFFLNELQQSKN